MAIMMALARRRGWQMAAAALMVLALGYQAWRSRWLWGSPEAGAAGAGAAGELVAVSGDPVGAELDRFMARLAAYGYSGSVLVAKGGRLLLHEGYGLADRARRRPYTPETLFDIASIAKQFTAAAILKLEMEGRLHVEDPLVRFFPGMPADKAGITLHQLLTHTSGLRDTFGEEYEPVSRQEMLRRVFASPLLGPPGRRYRYSNGGYCVLAAVVEVASGETYDSYLKSRLFAPAGMHDTGFRLPARDLPLVAHGYGAAGDWGTPLDHPWAPDGPYWNLRGNGGILSTTGDMYRWHLALGGDTVLSRAARDKYQTPYVSEGRWAHTAYAYGWSVGKSPTGRREISHIGGNGYFESDFRRYPDDGAVIILSGNSVDYSALAIGDHLENRLFGLRDPDPPAVAGLPGTPAGHAAGADGAASSGGASGAGGGGEVSQAGGVPPTAGAAAPAVAALAARCAGTFALPAGTAPGAGAGAARGDGADSGGGTGAGAGSGAAGACDGAETFTVAVDPAPWAPAGRLLVAAGGRRGLTLLLGALSDDDRDTVADRDQSVGAALTAARQGSWEPFAKVMGLEANEAAALLRTRLAALEPRLGAWTSAAVLGGAARGGRWFTYARCGFAHGASIAELGWAGPTAETLRMLDAVPAQPYLAEPEPGAFAAFDVRTGVTVHAVCDLPAGGGPAAALTLRSGGGAPGVRAIRVASQATTGPTATP